MPGADPRGVAADLGTADGVDAFLKKAPEADVLVNNLGIFDPKPFLEIPDAEWLHFFEVPGERVMSLELPTVNHTLSKYRAGRYFTGCSLWKLANWSLYVAYRLFILFWSSSGSFAIGGWPIPNSMHFHYRFLEERMCPEIMHP